jgi:hypothetical protein
MESGMAEVRRVGWSKGLKVVSLIQAIQEHAGIRLREAKALVEELRAGRMIAVSLRMRRRRTRFESSPADWVRNVNDCAPAVRRAGCPGWTVSQLER